MDRWEVLRRSNQPWNKKIEKKIVVIADRDNGPCFILIRRNVSSEKAIGLIGDDNIASCADFKAIARF
ncbi:hypothetical protein ATN00_02160 [Sphingobium baderi]|uniref:Uncharacterized protein n=1 Tax=Sphingobium baderi TaxID=1332080 RepID=A0A0S3EV37_9SPHN|nr:hypothetical protein ATN00_02160 [Sphingobium baderi]